MKLMELMGLIPVAGIAEQASPGPVTALSSEPLRAAGTMQGGLVGIRVLGVRALTERP